MDHESISTSPTHYLVTISGYFVTIFYHGIYNTHNDNNTTTICYNTIAIEDNQFAKC